MKIPIAGGATVTLASGQKMPAGVAVDDAYVYWTNATTDGTVLKVRKDQSAPQAGRECQIGWEP